jgi:hypothetical protein
MYACILVLFAGLLLLSGCNSGWVTVLDSTRELKGKTFIYYYNNSDGSSNGHDYMKYEFNEDGTGGDFEMAEFSYGYPTAAAEGDYRKQEWYQTGGRRGSFTYDPEAKTSAVTLTEVYSLKDSGLTGYRDDYAWRDVKYDVIGLGAAESDTASVSYQSVGIFTEDNLPRTAIRTSETSNDWEFKLGVTTTKTVGGETTTTEQNETTTYTVASTGITKKYVRIVTETTGSTTTTETIKETEEFSILKKFPQGESHEDPAFEDIWKEGSTVTFETDRNYYTYIYYVGDSEPNAPSVSQTTGIGGEMDGTAPDYYINQNGGNEETFTFTHLGDCLTLTDSTYAAYRGLQ